jgi:hypothetical protein
VDDHLQIAPDTLLPAKFQGGKTLAAGGCVLKCARDKQNSRRLPKEALTWQNRHRRSREPTTDTSSPGLTLSTRSFCNMVTMDLGMDPMARRSTCSWIRTS